MRLPKGGTGMGIRIAHDCGIPVLNLGVHAPPRGVCERLEQIRAASSPRHPSRFVIRGPALTASVPAPRGHPEHPHMDDRDPNGTDCEPCAPTRASAFEHESDRMKGEPSGEERRLWSGLRSEQGGNSNDHLRPRRHTGARYRHRVRGSSASCCAFPRRPGSPTSAAASSTTDFATTTGRPAQAGTTPPRRSRAGFEVIGDRLAPLFGGRRPEQCIVNEYRPGQGIGMHADHAVLRAGRRLAVPWRRVDDELPAAQPAPLRPRRACVRRSRHSPVPLRTRPARTRQEQPGCTGSIPPPPRAAARSASRQPFGRSRGSGAAVSVRAGGKARGHPSGIGSDG